MSDIEDWARAEAAKAYPNDDRDWDGWPGGLNEERQRRGFIKGAMARDEYLAERLQSPEAIEAAARTLFEESQELDQDNSWDDLIPDEWREAWLYQAREIVTAALAAITKGDGDGD